MNNGDDGNNVIQFEKFKPPKLPTHPLDGVRKAVDAYTEAITLALVALSVIEVQSDSEQIKHVASVTMKKIDDIVCKAITDIGAT